MGNSNSNTPSPEPPSTTLKPIQVRTRFNTPTQTSSTPHPTTQEAPKWHAVPYSPTVAAHGHAMCCVDDKVVMVGGTRKYPAINYSIIDLSSENLKHCIAVPFKGAPVDWSGLTATLVGHREHDNYCYNELFSIDIRTRYISRHENDTEGRTDHTACLVGRNIYFFAGHKVVPSTSSLLPCNDLVILDTGTLQWTKVNSTSGPCERYNHAAAAVGSLVFVHGGVTVNDSLLDDLWIFDTEKQAWSEARLKATSDRPPHISGHTLTAYGCRIFLFGAVAGEPIFFMLDVVNMEWHNLTNIENLPSGRYGHASDIANGRLLILGGTPRPNNFLGDLHSLDIRDILHLLSPPQPVHLQLRISMLELVNNPLCSDLTMYITPTDNNGNNNTRSADAHPLHLHKCVVFSRFPDFPQYFMAGKSDASEVDVFGFSFDVVQNVIQILYPTTSQTLTNPLKQQHTKEFTRFTTYYHLERVTCLAGEFEAPLDADVPPPPDALHSLAKDLTALLNSQLRADIVFLAQGTRFYAHRAVLSARSSYFRALFSASMRDSHADAEVDLGDTVDPRAFDIVLRHLYAAPVDLTQKGLDLLGILELCVQYLIDDLRVQVTRFLIGHLDMENAIALYEGAMVLDCPELKLACMEFIGWHFQDVCRLKEFHAMSEHHRAVVQLYFKLLNYYAKQ